MSGLKFIFDQVKLTGSSTGGMKITQECINFLAEKNLTAETKMITNLDELHEAEAELHNGNKSGTRYVLDIKKML